MKLLILTIATSIILISCEKKQNSSTNNTAQKIDYAQQSNIENKLNESNCFNFFEQVNKAREEFENIQEVSTERLKTVQIDSILNSIDFGEPLKDSLIGENDCNGSEIRLKCFSNGITQVGMFYNIYARDFYFGKKFEYFFGINNDWTIDNVKQTLGDPYKSNKNTLLYISDKATEDESEDFESRWSVYIFLDSNGKVSGLALCPNFNDC